MNFCLHCGVTCQITSADGKEVVLAIIYSCTFDRPEQKL